MYIKLTNLYNGVTIYIKPYKIDAIAENLDGTFIYINGNTISVKETPEQIFKLIEEIK